MELKPPQKAEKQLTLFVTFQVAPENIEKFKEAHRPVWKACSEEAECLLFDVFQDPDQPGRYSSKPLWIEDIHIEYFEREEEGIVWSDEYLAGGQKMEKEGRKEREGLVY
ncbi:hypothetical protein LAWI1_G006795 [Lachnellula willkommii]|uniref:ABM domain-containing protein n=1 Tax=Lachnellula willkommii TaxID=215461 RepID=A0A559M564_9HELO|nr:hypothetical protein LAWI1_G006795 [Lachnellula willkommii]